MFLIAGLGNPGTEYEGTRHNIGFAVVDALAASFSSTWKKGKGPYDVCQIAHGDRKLHLLKPLTYMNLSGQAVRQALDWFGLGQAALLVVTDDINLPVAQLRLKMDGSAGGHNGLTDISRHLGGNSWARLRFGVGRDFLPGRQADYVLSPFLKADREAVKHGIQDAADCILFYCKEGAEAAMNRFNSKSTLKSDL